MGLTTHLHKEKLESSPICIPYISIMLTTLLQDRNNKQAEEIFSLVFMKEIIIELY